MGYDMFNMEKHMARALTPEEEVRLQARLSQLPVFVDDAPYLIEELAEISKAPNPKESAKDLDSLLPILDNSWKWEDFESASEDERLWLGTRLMYFIGEWLIYRCGGRWFVPSDPASDLFAFYAISFFSHGIPAATVVDPRATMYNYMQQPPGRSLISELERLWRDALALERDLIKVSRIPDQMEYARQAVLEEREQGATEKRCMSCGSKFVCSEKQEDGTMSYTIRCETGCYGICIYDLQQPLEEPHKITFIVGDEENATGT